MSGLGSGGLIEYPVQGKKELCRIGSNLILCFYVVFLLSIVFTCLFLISNLKSNLSPFIIEFRVGKNQPARLRNWARLNEDTGG